MYRLILCFIFLTILISCDSSYKLADGEQRAFVEEYNTDTNLKREFAAQVYVRNGVVKKITNSTGESFEDFDFWETKNKKRQDVYTRGPKVYSVYLIEEDQ
jgi:hypothetical protein